MKLSRSKKIFIAWTAAFVIFLLSPVCLRSADVTNGPVQLQSNSAGDNLPIDVASDSSDVTKRILQGLGLGMVLAIVAAIVCVFWWSTLCHKVASGRVYGSLETVPVNEVGIVLGTAKLTKSGNLNRHFTRRIEAAAALYRAGKVRHLLVSGDKRQGGYDEPMNMRHALVEAGVPDGAITSDNAGFRTLDSVLRANRVFGLDRFTVITERFHCPRALWVARRHGLDVVAFAASSGPEPFTQWVYAREYLARTACGLDLYVLNRGPKVAGPREPIVLNNGRTA